MEWLLILLGPWGWMFDVYVVMQIIAAIKLRGLGRWLSLLPVPIMLYVLWITGQAYHLDSNIWPIMLILASPIAVAYLIFSFLIYCLIPRRRIHTPGTPHALRASGHSHIEHTGHAACGEEGLDSDYIASLLVNPVGDDFHQAEGEPHGNQQGNRSN